MGKKNSNPQTMGNNFFKPLKKKEKVLPPLPVAATTWAMKFIEDFRNSGLDSQVIEKNLTNSERGIIHNICQRTGLGSKSHGKGDERRLSIFIKEKNKDASGQNKGIPIVKKKSAEVKKCVSFPPEAKAVLHELFTRYPPCDSDTTGTTLGLYTGNFVSHHKDDFFLKPQLNKDDIKMKVARLAADKRCRQIFEVRAKLPIASFRDAILSAVESNQVVLIAGETGCGKTTQVPQYLLDHMWSKQEACKIICTQPRRISAISVSERISWERGENIGENIGYKVRLESEGGRWSSVVFCTNGILLRVLVGKGVNSCVPAITHIIVDEIHERDCYSDFMLAILRDLLPSNPHLRLILMSATLDAKRFSEYFGGCPVVRVPGFTYPVRTFFLEDALSVLESDENNHKLSADSTIPGGKRDFNEEDKVALDEAIDLAWKNDEFDALLDLVSSEECHQAYNYQESKTGLTPLMVFAGKGMVSDVCKLLSFGADYELKSKEGITALELAEKENQFGTAHIIKEHNKNIQSKSQQAKNLLKNYMAKTNPDAVDVGLIVNLMKKICDDSEEGAILVFLPGWEEIVHTKERLLVDPFFSNSSKFSIICLHSKVPAAEQKKVFSHPRPGCRKIVLSTNIAESAVTIEDVVFVIDSGRMKEKGYDPYNDVSTLQSSWVSKANAKQREGRAGRCQPGICYHLYSKLRAASLPEFRVPEVRRIPVDELCLQVKMLDPSCNVNVFLQKLMDPPVAQSIANALTILQDIGALTPQEGLTELGHKFGLLPVHPRISKMLYFAILVNCLDPALILACAADTKDPFIMPLLAGEKMKAAAAKHELASFYGDHSDHLAIVAAFQCWEKAKESGRDNKFCSKYFLSPSAMTMLDSLRLKLQGELRRHGVIPSSSNCSLNAYDPGILRAVVAVGLYPMLGRMCPLSNTQRMSLVETITGAKVRVLSLNKVTMSSSKYDEALIIFDEITQGDRDLHIRSCTLLPTVPLLLFSREIAVSPTESYDADKSDDEEDHEVENVGDAMDIDIAGGRPEDKIMLVPENSVKVIVDRWLPFKVTACEIAQMYILRQRLMASILFKVNHPKENLPPHLGASMYAIASILSYDGVTQPSVKTVAVKPVALVVDATILRDDIPSASPSEIQEHDPNTTPMGSMLESANTSGLVNMEESLPSTVANGSEQPDPNTAPMEAVSVDTQQNKMQSSSKKRKSVNNVDLGNIEENLRNMEENKPSDLANNGNEQTMPKSASNLDTLNLEENKPSDLADRNEQTLPKSASNLDMGNMEENMPSDLANGNEKTELKPAKLLDLENLEDNTLSDLANRNGQKEPKSVNNSDLGNMEENTPSDLANENEQIENTTPMESTSAGKQPKKRQSRSKKCESVNYVDLGSMEESLKNKTPSDLGNGNEQTEPNTALSEAASTVKRSKKRHSKSKRHKLVDNDDLGNMEENTTSDLANGNEQTEPKSVNNLDLENIKNKTPSDVANLNEQTESNTAQVEAVSVDKQPKKKQSRSKRSKSIIKVDFANMEEDTPSDLANGNVQAEPNSASNLSIGNTIIGNEQTEPKSVINLDLGNVEEKMLSDLANGNEKSEPKSTNMLDLENKETNTPSNLGNGNEQTEPKTAPMEAASADKQPKRRRSKSKMQKLTNNLDLGNVEEQTELKPPNKLDYGNMDESLPSNLASGDEQPDPNTAPMDSVSAANQPEKKRPRSKKRKSSKNLDLENMEEKKPSDLADGNEQLDPNIAPEEADSAPNQPKKKHSRSKKRKLANNL